MPGTEGNGGTYLYRVQELERLTREIERRAEAAEKATTLHQEQINGEGGLRASINALRADVQGLKRAIYTVGAGVVVAAVTAIFTLGPH